MQRLSAGDRPGFALGPRTYADPAAQVRVRQALETEGADELVGEARALGAGYLVLRAGGPLDALVTEASADVRERVYPPSGLDGGVTIYRLAGPPAAEARKPHYLSK